MADLVEEEEAASVGEALEEAAFTAKLLLNKLNLTTQLNIKPLQDQECLVVLEAH